MRFFLVVLLFALFSNCDNGTKQQKQLIDFIPSDSELVLRSKNLENFKSAIEANSFLKSLCNTNGLDKLAPITKLNTTGTVLTCLSKTKNDSLEYTIITKFSETLFKTDSLKNYVEETLKYKTHNIKRSSLNKNTFYSTVIDSTFILSSSKTIINESLNNDLFDKTLKKLYSVSDKNKDITLLVNSESALCPAIFLEDSLKPNVLTNHFTLDLEILQNDIYFNGVAQSADSSKKVIDLFKNTVPQENQIQNIVPGNTNGFLSFTFDDYEVFHNNLKSFAIDSDSTSTHTNLFNNISEIGVIYDYGLRAIVLNSYDIIATQEALIEHSELIDVYRGIKIKKFSKDSIFQSTFKPFLEDITTSKFCVIDHFFVFSNSMDALQNIIANYQNKTTLDKLDHFKSLKEKLSSESSILFVAKPELTEKIITKMHAEDVKANLSDNDLYAIQFVYDSNFAHIHGGFIKAIKKSKAQSISEHFSLNLDTDLLTAPQFATNHVTKQKDIVVQDVNNTLYLISNSGDILWKKKLNGEIIGKIEQIDMYKNGKLQLAFVTPNNVYVVDRKGRDVAPFPLKFNQNITQPLSVFDYEHNKDYRLLVTQGKNVLMLNARGKRVMGFKFSSTKTEIISQPKHFRIGTKDYLVLKTKNKLYILNRTGKTRVEPKTETTFSAAPVFLYQNKFTTTTQDGEFISIDTKGNTATVNLNLGKTHHLETTSKTRVTLNDNILNIKGRVIELDYGDYSKPQIFYLNDKIYITVTDLQSNSILMFDSQGKTLPNFPVYGSSKIDLDNIDTDPYLEFITKGETNSIILYQIN
ncbi:hypothetical protein MHTCC0001_18890 [Flavobacteriaceae bacterium MHTCC 0001]